MPKLTDQETWSREPYLKLKVARVFTAEDKKEAPKELKVRNITKFLENPMDELYEQGFFDIKPDEIKIRLRVRDGQVEMVVFALHAGRVNEFVVPFDQDEVALELCG